MIGGDGPRSEASLLRDFALFELKAGGETYRDLASAFGVSRTRCRQCVRREWVRRGCPDVLLARRYRRPMIDQ